MLGSHTLHSSHPGATERIPPQATPSGPDTAESAEPAGLILYIIVDNEAHTFSTPETLSIKIAQGQGE